MAKHSITLGIFSAEGVANLEDRLYAQLARTSPEGDSVEVSSAVGYSAYDVAITFDTEDVGHDALIAHLATALAQ